MNKRKKDITLAISILINCIQILILYRSEQGWILQFLLVLICARLIKVELNDVAYIVSFFILLASFFSLMDVVGLMNNIIGIFCVIILVLYLICMLKRKR